MTMVFTLALLTLEMTEKKPKAAAAELDSRQIRSHCAAEAWKGDQHKCIYIALKVHRSTNRALL